MRRKITILATGLMMFGLIATTTMGQYPGSGQEPIDPTSIPKFVDFLPHFAGMRVDARGGESLIIKAVSTQQVAVSTGTVLDNGVVGTDPGAGLGTYFVYTISNNGGTTWTLPLWPSFTIEAQRGKPLDVEVKNELYGLTYEDVNIAADQTIMMNGVPLTGDPMTEPYTGPIPIALHLHGGEVPSASDGGATAWFTPGYELTGEGWNQGVGPVLHYPNEQEAATIWYHEHSQLGLTRVNVYAGMEGFYFLRGPDEEQDKLPGFSKDDLVKEVTPAGKTADALHPAAYLPEIELAIQDRMFDTNGELYYPVEEAPNPEIHPFWAPEFFADVITVNGKTWPYLSVAPRKYRFHVLDGSNARFFRMWLQNASTGAVGPAITQVGTDGGLLDSPVTINPVTGQKLLLGCGERADIVIDFSKVPPGTVLTLMNDAPTPFPMGDPVQAGTTDRIMQFVVNGVMVDNKKPDKPGKDKSMVPPNLRGKPMVKLSNFAGGVNITPSVTRQLTLNEVLTEEGPEMVLINNSRFEDMPEMDMFGEITEKPVEGTTEKWQLINLTMDAHPMHMHLVQFQLVSRQNFNDMAYMDDYMNSFTGVNGGMSGMWMGAEGPPFLYDDVNTDGAIGGNIPISSYLTGAPIPPNPNERGWKDVIISYPGQVTTYIVRFAPTDLKLNSSPQKLVYPFDPGIGPDYLWHCHIVEHEDNDMMRPLAVVSSPVRNAPAKPVAINTQGEESNDLFVLGQNFPNPVINETRISFSLSDAGHVRLILLDQMGREVQKLMVSDVQAGTYTVSLNTMNLSDGIYFYQLRAGNYVQTKKMIISK